MLKHTFGVGVSCSVLIFGYSFSLMNLEAFLSCCCGTFGGTKGRQGRKLSHAKGKNPGLEQNNS